MSLARHAVAAALMVIGTCLPASAQLPAEWLGTWHLDVASSTFVGKPPYVRGTWKVTATPEGGVLMVYDQVGTRGGVTHMEWKGRFDGLDYRLQGPDAVVTYAYTQIDAATLDLVVKVDGRPTATARVVLTPDNVVTATARNTTARGTVTTTTVYRRR
jgi:hypothetical protein